jgi:hypothetical protein
MSFSSTSNWMDGRAGDQVNENAPPEVAEWLVVIRADGVVESAEGGAPVTWLGHLLVDAPGVMEPVRRAAAELVGDSSTSPVRRRRVRCADGKARVHVEVLLVEALPIRRTHMRVNDLAMRTLDLFTSQAKTSNIDLTVNQAEDLPAAFVLDGEKIAWALSMLVGNALRYARKHVGVSLRWDAATSELVIEVSDDGPGIPDQRTRWLFERNPASGQSAGLALLMVRDVMVAHHGSVNVHSHVGRGTTFTLHIPRVHGVRPT